MKIFNIYVIKIIIYLYILSSLSILPLFVNKVFTQQDFLITTCVICTSLLLLSVKFVCRKISWQFSWIDIIMMLWGVYILILIFFITDVPLDISILYSYFSPFILYFIVRNLACYINIRTTFLIILLAIVSQVIFSTSNELHLVEGIRIKAVFTNSGLFAGYLAIGVTISVFFLLFGTELIKNKRFHTILYIPILSILAVSVYMIIQTTSRAALLAVVVSFLFVIYFKYRDYLKKTNGYYRIVFMIVALAAIIYTGYNLYEVKSASADGRLYIWKICSEMYCEKPLFGYGIGGFFRNYMFHQADYFQESPTSSFSYLASDTKVPFNEFIKIGIEQGIIGFLLFLGLVFVIFNTRGKDRSYIHLLPKTVVVSILVFGFFSYPSEVFQFRFVFILCLVFISVNRKNEKYTISCDNNAIVRVACTIVVVLFVFIGSHSYENSISYNQFRKVLYSDLTPKNKISGLEGVYADLSYDIDYLSVYGSLLNECGQYEQALNVLVQLEKYYPSASQQIEKGLAYYNLGKISEANRAWILASYMYPALIKPHYWLAKSYYSINDYERAEWHIDHVLAHPPKVNVPEIYYMREELKGILNNIKKIP